MCPEDFVWIRIIGNGPPCSENWNLWGNSVGARDFSPDWKHRYFGTEVPCPDNDKHQFIALITQTLAPECRKAVAFQEQRL